LRQNKLGHVIFYLVGLQQFKQIKPDIFRTRVLRGKIQYKKGGLFSENDEKSGIEDLLHN